MKFFRVTVVLEAHVRYLVQAETRAEAEKIALERADDGMGFGDMDLVDRDVWDVEDETAEHT